MALNGSHHKRCSRKCPFCYPDGGKDAGNCSGRRTPQEIKQQDAQKNQLKELVEEDSCT